jgi:hypothetical protein
MTTSHFADLLKDFNRNPPADEATIRDFETTAGISLPVDYRLFLQHTNGGEGFLGAEESYVILWRVDELIKMNKAYEIEEYCPQVFVFGSDGGGEAFGFDLRSDAKLIVAIPFVGMDESVITPVAEDFETFLSGDFFR